LLAVSPINHSSPCTKFTSSDAISLSPTKPVKTPLVLGKREQTLNPKALEFKPSWTREFDEYTEMKPHTQKRKYESFILHIDSNNRQDDYCSDISNDDSDIEFHDEELDLELKSIYQATSSLFGWDFEKKEQLNTPSIQWIDPSVLLTTPNNVVRYFPESCTMCNRSFGRACRVHHYTFSSKHYVDVLNSKNGSAPFVFNGDNWWNFEDITATPPECQYTSTMYHGNVKP